MTPINWTLGETIEINGERYRIHSRAKSGALNLEHIRDGRFETRPDSELATLWGDGELVRLHDTSGALSERRRNMLERPYSDLPPKVKVHAERRLPYMKAFVERKLRTRSRKRLDPLIAEVAVAVGDLTPPSARQLSRWLAKWFAIGSPDLRDIRCIAPCFHLRGNSKNRFDPEVDEIVWDTIEDMWLKPNRESAESILEVANAHIDNLSLEGREKQYLDADGRLRRPSLRTIYRLLQEIPKDVVVRGQRGKLEAERTCDPVVGGPQGSKPLEEVEIDHTLLDVIVVDTDRNIPLGRPWLTVALDRHTRMILGAYTGFHPPGAYTVMMCLRNAIKPKKDLLDRYSNIRNDWPCFGKPQTIIVDNGPEFHSRSFTEACLSLNIDIVYCPARKPRYKGKVERWFGRLAKQVIHKIPGTTFSNTKQRGDYQAEKMAVMTLDDVRGAVLKWIVDDYSRSLHRGINDIPIRRWEEGVNRHPVQMPARADELDVLLSHVEERTLTRKGIEIYGLRYSEKSLGFHTLINRPDKPERVMVKVEFGNLASIRIQDWRTGRYIEIPSTDPEYTNGLSLAEHNILVARLKARLKKYERVTVKGLLESRQEFRALIQKLKRDKKLTSKRLIAAVCGDDEFSEIVVPTQDAPKADAAPSEKMGSEAQPVPKSPPQNPKNAARKSDPIIPPDDDNDDLAALRARIAAAGIVAETIR